MVVSVVIKIMKHQCVYGKTNRTRYYSRFEQKKSIDLGVRYYSIKPQALALMQAALGGLQIDDWTMRGEQASMLEVAARILGCCAESLAVPGRGGGLGCAVSLRLMRSVRLKMWMDTEVNYASPLWPFGCNADRSNLMTNVSCDEVKDCLYRRVN